MTIQDVNISNNRIGLVSIYQVSNMINENNKLFEHKINELNKNYELKLNELTLRINNKKWKIFKILLFIFFNFF